MWLLEERHAENAREKATSRKGEEEQWTAERERQRVTKGAGKARTQELLVAGKQLAAAKTRHGLASQAVAGAGAARRVMAQQDFGAGERAEVQWRLGAARLERAAAEKGLASIADGSSAQGG